MSNTATTKRTQNSASLADIIVFIVSFALFVFGLYLFGAGFFGASGTEFWLFWAGLLASSLSFLIPVVYHWIVDRKA